MKLLLFGLCGSAALCVAPAALGQNLLGDPGFEAPIGGGPVAANAGSWVNFFGGPSGTVLEAQSLEPAGGPPLDGAEVLSLVIDGSDGSNNGFGAFAGVAQRVGGVSAGAAYTFSLSARAESFPINSGLEFRLEWVDASGSVIGTPTDPGDPNFNNTEISGGLTAGFQGFELTDTAPPGAVALNAVIAAQSFLNDGVNPAFIDAAIDAASLVLEDPPEPTDGDILLVDEFDGASLDTSLWFQPTGPGTFLGRTQMRPPSFPIEVSGGVARLVVDTFNPTGFSFFGSEIRTVEAFELGDGLIFETRSRLLDGTPGGILGSLFMFTTNGAIRDEIDWEILSNDIPGSPDDVLTNVFSDDDFSQPGNSAFVTQPGLDITEFNTYRIEWRPDRVDWFLNGVLVRTVSVGVPDGELPGTVFDPVRIHLNAWAPDQFFAVAFNAGIQPVGSAALNQRFTYEVDRVEIRRVVLGPCNAADVAEPFGELDVLDTLTVVNALAAGVIDIFDLLDTLEAFDEGCP